MRGGGEGGGEILPLPAWRSNVEYFWVNFCCIHAESWNSKYSKYALYISFRSRSQLFTDSCQISSFSINPLTLIAVFQSFSFVKFVYTMRLSDCLTICVQIYVCYTSFTATYCYAISNSLLIQRCQIKMQARSLLSASKRGSLQKIFIFLVFFSRDFIRDYILIRSIFTLCFLEPQTWNMLFAFYWVIAFAQINFSEGKIL